MRVKTLLVIAALAVAAGLTGGAAAAPTRATCKRGAGTFTGSTHVTPRVKVTGSFSC